MERSFDAALQLPKSKSAFGPWMAGYPAVVTHRVVFMIQCDFAVVCLQVVEETLGIFCWFLYVQGGCVLGEVFPIKVGVSAPPISAATASV